MPWTTHIAGQNWTAGDLNYLGNRIVDTGTLAQRPATGSQVGQHFYAQDTFQDFLWNGTIWIVFSEPWTAWTAVLLGSNNSASNAASVALSAGALYKRDNGRVSLLYTGTVTNIFGQTLTGQITVCNLPVAITTGVGSIRVVSGIDQVGIAQFTTGYAAITSNPAGGSIVNGQIGGIRDNAGVLMNGTIAVGNFVTFNFVAPCSS